MENRARYVFQVSVGILFGYFGMLALLDPEREAAKWVTGDIATLIEYVMPVATFVFIFGLLEVAVAAALIADRLTRIALLVAAAMLIGVIINLGWNEIALRDVIILLGIGHLYFTQEKNHH